MNKEKEKKEAMRKQAEDEKFLEKKAEELKSERSEEAKMKRLVQAMELVDKQNSKMIPVLSAYQGNYLLF